MVIGNSRYAGGGTPVAPNAWADDGMLALHAVEAPDPCRLQSARTLWCLARIGIRLRRGRHLLAPWVRDPRTERLRLEAFPPQEMEADGERLGRTPATFPVLPRALRALIPDGGAPRPAGE
jgi:diacylglycerol kinase (ATP)